MPGIAGRKALVRVPGSALTLTAAATTNAGDNKTYRITNTAQRVLVPDAAITVNVGGSPTAEVYTLNRLRGEVVFATVNAGRAAVTITGQYLPLASAVGARGYSYTLAAAPLDATTFDSADSNNGFPDRVQGMLDVSGSISLRWSTDVVLRDALLNATTVVLEFYSDRNATRDLAVWALLNKNQVDAAVDSLVERGIEWQGEADADGRAASL